MKRVICIFVATIVLLSGITTAHAATPRNIYTEYKFYTASIYLCDPSNNQVILRNVKPINPMDGLVGARAIEYTAVGINTDFVFGKDGKWLSLETINEKFLDLEVIIFVGRNNYGQKVLYISY